MEFLLILIFSGLLSRSMVVVKDCCFLVLRERFVRMKLASLMWCECRRNNKINLDFNSMVSITCPKNEKARNP